MPTERFHITDFESALPLSKDTGKKLWYYYGIDKGERCYMVPVNEEVEIMVRSSIKEDREYCEDTGEDSIRVTLVDSIDHKPLESRDAKLQRWIARTKNWRTRMIEVLRHAWRHGDQLTTCPKCKTEMLRISRVKNGVNVGKLYISCWNKKCNQGFHSWLEE